MLRSSPVLYSRRVGVVAGESDMAHHGNPRAQNGCDDIAELRDGPFEFDGLGAAFRHQSARIADGLGH